MTNDERRAQLTTIALAPSIYMYQDIDSIFMVAYTTVVGLHPEKAIDDLGISFANFSK